MKLHDPESSQLSALTLNEDAVEEQAEVVAPPQRKTRAGLFSVWGLVSIAGLSLVGLVIALPSFMNQANIGCGKQSEAMTNVGAMGRAQQAHYLEQGKFAQTMPDLGLGIREQTENYQYGVRSKAKVAYNYGVSRKPDRHSYVSGVFLVPVKDKPGETTTVVIGCRAMSPGAIRPFPPSLVNGQPLCGPDTQMAWQYPQPTR